MGDGVSVDVERVRAVVDALSVSADALAAAAESVAGARFGPAAAGRNYGEAGENYVTAHRGLGRAVGAWKSSVDDVAAALGASLDDYEQQDGSTAYAIESHR